MVCLKSPLSCMTVSLCASTLRIEKSTRSSSSPRLSAPEDVAKSSQFIQTSITLQRQHSRPNPFDFYNHSPQKGDMKSTIGGDLVLEEPANELEQVLKCTIQSSGTDHLQCCGLNGLAIHLCSQLILGERSFEGFQGSTPQSTLIPIIYGFSPFLYFIRVDLRLPAASQNYQLAACAIHGCW